MRRSIVLITAGCATSFVVLTSSPVPAGADPARAATCRGLTPTIVASGGVVEGTSGPDVILASGETQVLAREGDDTICVEAGSVDAGPGNDVVDATAGASTTELGAGDDTYLGGPGRDSVSAVAGRDDVRTGGGLDAVTSGLAVAQGGEPNRDRIDTGSGRDTVNLYAWSAELSVRTGSQRDTVWLFGGYPTPGEGGVLSLGRGADLLDMEYFRDVDIDLAERRGDFDDARFAIKGAENVTADGTMRISIRGTRGPNQVRVGGVCRATVRGGGGADVLQATSATWADDNSPCPDGSYDTRARLFGQAGNDYLRGWRGDDRLIGGPGRDEARGRGGRDVCRAETKGSCER